MIYIKIGMILMITGMIILFIIHKTSFSTKMKIGYIACAIGIIICTYGLCDLQSDAANFENADVIRTVAHVDLSNRIDLELVAMDYENDVAIYKYVKPDYDIEVGDTVYLVGGATAIVVSSDAVGFTISSDSITAGMSGTAVTVDSGVQIGCVSSRLADGNYRCIWS